MTRSDKNIIDRANKLWPKLNTNEKQKLIDSQGAPLTPIGAALDDSGSTESTLDYLEQLKSNKKNGIPGF